MPSDRPRVLDFLNRCAVRFITVIGEGEASLVNVRAIEHVRPRD
jgi:hypothetical protein